MWLARHTSQSPRRRGTHQTLRHRTLVEVGRTTICSLPTPLEPQRAVQQPAQRGVPRGPPPVADGEEQGLLLTDEHHQAAGAGQGG